MGAGAPAGVPIREVSVFPKKFLLPGAAVLLAAAFLFFGPSYPRRASKLSPASVASIRSGITSKAQVQALLGPPQVVNHQVPVRQPPGTETLPVKYLASEIWMYWTRSEKRSWFRSRAAERLGYGVTLFFDERGTVLDCQVEAVK